MPQLVLVCGLHACPPSRLRALRSGPLASTHPTAWAPADYTYFKTDFPVITEGAGWALAWEARLSYYLARWTSDLASRSPQLIWRGRTDTARDQLRCAEPAAAWTAWASWVCLRRGSAALRCPITASRLSPPLFLPMAGLHGTQADLHGLSRLPGLQEPVTAH